MDLHSLSFCLPLPGILLALLPGVLSKERGENRLFKAHIIAVNVVALGQTIISGFVPFTVQDHGGGKRAVCILV